MPVLIEEHRQIVLEFDRLDGPGHLRVRLLWRGEHVVTRSTHGQRGAGSGWPSSGPDVFEPFGRFLGGIVAEDFKEVPFTGVESCDAVPLRLE